MSTESSGEKTFASHPPNKGTDQVERDTCLTWFPGFLYQLLRSSLSIRPDLQLVISRWNLMARSSDGIYPRRPCKVVLGHQARSSGVSAEGIRGIPRRIRLLAEWLRMEWGQRDNTWGPTRIGMHLSLPSISHRAVGWCPMSWKQATACIDWKLDSRTSTTRKIRHR